MNAPIDPELKPMPADVLPPRTGWLRRQFEDILYVAKRDKKWWLLPLLLLLLVLALLMAIASAAGPLAPFVYPFL